MIILRGKSFYGIVTICGTKHARMDQVKFVEYSL